MNTNSGTVMVTLKSGEKVECNYCGGLDFWPVNGHPLDKDGYMHSYTDLAISHVDGIPSNNWLRIKRSHVGIIDKVRTLVGLEMRGY